MISRAGLRIDTETRCDYLLSRCQLFPNLRAKAPLQGQLALAFCDDDFQSTGCCGECIAKGFHHAGNFVCHTGSYPLHPDTLQSGLDVVASADPGGGMLGRRKILLAGSRRVAVVHDDKN